MSHVWMRRVGLTLLGLGLAIVAVLVGFVKFTGYRQHQAQVTLGSELAHTWNIAPRITSAASAAVTPRSGKALMVLRIPQIGLRQVVLEGVSTADLERGPGHYPGTALPGQLGNVAIAGHRVTYGGPFRHLDQLQPGAEIDIDTQDRTYVYHVRSAHDVTPSDIGVTFAVPGQAQQRPTQRLLTLTTCTPPYSAAQRLIVVAEFSRVV
jgi:sortase A